MPRTVWLRRPDCLIAEPRAMRGSLLLSRRLCAGYGLVFVLRYPPGVPDLLFELGNKVNLKSFIPIHPLVLQRHASNQVSSAARLTVSSICSAKVAAPLSTTFFPAPLISTT